MNFKLSCASTQNNSCRNLVYLFYLKIAGIKLLEMSAFEVYFEKVRKQHCYKLLPLVIRHLSGQNIFVNVKNKAKEIVFFHAIFMKLKTFKVKRMKSQWCNHIKTSQLICSANPLTGFYMMPKTGLS